MKQNGKKTYAQLKAKYPDVILLLRCRDIYKSWDNDAELICELTSSTKLLRKRLVASCTIQTDQRDHVVNRLVKAGYKVAIWDPL